MTGGPSGLVGIPSSRIAGFAFDTDRSMYYLVLGLIVLLVLMLLGGMRSGFGRALMAIRADRLAAGALGINVARDQDEPRSPSPPCWRRWRAASTPSISTSSRRTWSGPQRSFEMITMLVIGGEGTLVGPTLRGRAADLAADAGAAAGALQDHGRGRAAGRWRSASCPRGIFGGLARLLGVVRRATGRDGDLPRRLAARKGAP